MEFLSSIAILLLINNKLKFRSRNRSSFLVRNFSLILIKGCRKNNKSMIVLLVQQLAGCHIDTHSIIVNQVLFLTPGENPNSCRRCASSMRLQQKYIEQVCYYYLLF